MKGEKIHYVDVISLLPYICKNGNFPRANRKFTSVQTVPLTPDTNANYFKTLCNELMYKNKLLYDN